MTGKLDLLAEIEGYSDSMEMLEAIHTDSVSPGICTRPGCDYTCEVEPDCMDGWCEECEAGTVQSALILAGIV